MEPGVPEVVSVIVVTRNSPELARRAIDSVLEQCCPSLELIVIDDASSPPFKLHAHDPRVRLVRTDVAGGVAAARNLGLRECRGEFIAFLDDDDEYLPGKLENQLDYLRAHAEADMVFSKVRIVDETGEARTQLADEHVHDPFWNFYAYNVIHTNSTLLRRRVIESVTFDERLTAYEDTQFYLDICRRFDVHFLPIEVALWYRDVRQDQISQRDLRRSYDNFRILCSIFHGTIDPLPALRWRYYGRLAWHALRCLDPLGFVRALRCCLFGSRRAQALRSSFMVSAERNSAETTKLEV